MNLDTFECTLTLSRANGTLRNRAPKSASSPVIISLPFSRSLCLFLIPHSLTLFRTRAATRQQESPPHSGNSPRVSQRVPLRRRQPGLPTAWQPCNKISLSPLSSITSVPLPQITDGPASCLSCLIALRITNCFSGWRCSAHFWEFPLEPRRRGEGTRRFPKIRGTSLDAGGLHHRTTGYTKWHVAFGMV